MGQKLDTMSQRRSNAELLYEIVNTGNLEAIKALHREGASLEWTDEEGKTPLILACMDAGLLRVARILIELGANVNAYRPGRHGGTPLHHAAKRGLEQTVELLLSQRANALVRNDDCQTPLDVARFEGHTNIVRAIENHVCYFFGWLREFYGPEFLEALTPQLLSRKIWVVVIPYNSSSRKEALKLELTIYPTSQDSQPRTVIALWKCKVEEPTFDQSDAKLAIFDDTTGTRYKFASAREGDKQQIQCLYSACRGFSQFQVTPTPVLPGTLSQTSSVGAPVQFESIHTNGWGSSDDHPSHYRNHNGWGPALEGKHSEVNCNGWMNEPAKDNYNGWGVLDSGPVQAQHFPVFSVNTCGNVSAPSRPSPLAKDNYNGWGVLDPEAVQVEHMTQHVQSHDTNSSVVSVNTYTCASVPSRPSAPPLPDEVSGELSPLDLHVPSTNDGGGASCVICWEAPIEGACVPCGHMAGCTSCLNEIKANKGVCPICRNKIDQVVRLYAV